MGLDVGSSAVKAVELKPTSRGYRLVNLGSEPVPADCIVDGTIIDSSSVADAIRRVFDSRRIATRDVIASLSGSAVIVKKITLPVMSDEELAESISWEAEQYIPFDIQDVNIDYQVVESAGGEGGRGTMEVLLVAAKKDKIADYTGVIAQAGRVAVVVDVDAFALQNAFELNYGIDPGVVVLLNVGASAININIVSAGQTIFTRDLSVGGNTFTEALQKELSLPFEQADLLKRGAPVDGVSFEDARPVLHAVTENVLLEIQKTFDFFLATSTANPIGQIMLSGGGARLEGLASAVAERFGVPATTFDPFRALEIETARTGNAPAELSATGAVAVGLAIRRVDDR